MIETLFLRRDNDSSRRPSPGFKTFLEARDQFRALERYKKGYSERRCASERNSPVTALSSGADVAEPQCAKLRPAKRSTTASVISTAKSLEEAYERVLHIENRDIVEDNELPDFDCRTILHEAQCREKSSPR